MKRINKVNKKYNYAIIRFIIACILIFLLGFVLGYLYSYNNLYKLNFELEDLQLRINSMLDSIRFYEVFGSRSCNKELLDQLSHDVGVIGRELDKIEKQGAKDEKYYIFLKKHYSINQVLYYTIYKEYVDKCNMRPNIILYFYDRTNKSIKQGKILDEIVKEYNTKVVAIEYNFTPSLHYFYEYYKIKKLPSIIINFNKTLEGLKEKQEITPYLTFNNTNNSTIINHKNSNDNESKKIMDFSFKK